MHRLNQLAEGEAHSQEMAHLALHSSSHVLVCCMQQAVIGHTVGYQADPEQACAGHAGRVTSQCKGCSNARSRPAQCARSMICAVQEEADKHVDLKVL